jgi:hypothetical protein
LSNDFWLKKLAEASGRLPGRAPAAQQADANQPPTHAMEYRPWWDTTPVQARQQAVKQQQTAEYRPHQAKSAEHAGHCPHCRSGNYMPVQTHPVEVFRCFDCSPLQSIAAVQNTGEAAQATRQVSTENNYNPGVIIAKA